MKIFAFRVPNGLDAVVCARDYPEAVGLLRASGVDDFLYDDPATWRLTCPLPTHLQRRAA